MGYLAELQTKDKDELINMLYNRYVEAYADYDDDDKSTSGKHGGHGKRIPYIGWFWRSTDFVGKRVSIGDSGGMIGVMENNKWDYPERLMTEEEVDTFVRFLDAAHEEMDKGGDVAKTLVRVETKFDELWDWFQSLRMDV